MNNSDIQFDAKEVLSMFSLLTSKQQDKVYRTALKKASAILTKDTKARIKSSLGKVASVKNKRSGKSLLQGVKTKSVSPKATKIHIMGEFRLKWFEKGTQKRATKKNYNRGAMTKKYYFFRDAKASKETEIFNSIETLITESIQRIAK